MVFGVYRFLLPVLAAWKAPVSTSSLFQDQESFSVGLVTVSHAITPLLTAKLQQFQQLQVDLEGSRTPVQAVYVGLDGVAPPRASYTEETTVFDNSLPVDSLSVEWVSSTARRGKNHVLRDIVRQASTDVLVFSDVDADVNSASSRSLLEHLHHGDIGAVTGCRQIHDNSGFAAGQKTYVAGDDRIRAAEMKYLGSVTSSDGKLYAIKRELIDELPADVTDDLYTALGAIASGQRLVSEPAARAIIGRPAKNMQHELKRRRRVTTRGLTTLWRRRSLMNPLRTGGYGVALFINKVLRRLAGPGLILSATCLLLLTLMLLSQLHSGWLLVLVALSLVLFAMMLGSASLRYLMLGLFGMSMGVIDFIFGKRIEQWEPRKQLADSGDSGHVS